MNKCTLFWATLCLTLCSKAALAADTQGGTLPYESWLRSLQQSLTGPVAFSVALIGIITCGATLIFMGGEIGRFMRSLVYIILVMTMLVGANSLMTSFFNGASIGLSPAQQQALYEEGTAPAGISPDIAAKAGGRGSAQAALSSFFEGEDPILDPKTPGEPYRLIDSPRDFDSLVDVPVVEALQAPGPLYSHSYEMGRFMASLNARAA